MDRSGTCEACGHVGEVDKLEIEMARMTGFKRASAASFPCSLCETCQRKIFLKRINFALATFTGAAVACLPFFWTAKAQWALQGRYSLPVLCAVGLLVTLNVMARLFRTGLLESVPAYRRYKNEQYWLVNMMTGRFLARAVFVYFVTSAGFFLGAVGMRAWQSTWVARDGKVVAWESLTKQRTGRHSRLRNQWVVIGHRMSVKFDYAYQVSGRVFMGTDYGCVDTKGNIRPENPWKAGAPVRVYCDPARPEYGNVDKVSVVPFACGLAVAAALELLFLMNDFRPTEWYVRLDPPALDSKRTVKNRVCRKVEAKAT